jgi:cytochrome c biogenesis protein CcmG/thiol:disulfide interchange protein DsbE
MVGVKRWLVWLPLCAFGIIVAVVMWGLYLPADRTVYSAMVGKPLPAFTLPPAVAGKPGLSDKDFRQGKPRLLNVFASWCIPCIAEAPQLLTLKAAGVAIDAVAIRDTGPAITAFLRRNGDPYARIGDDATSRLQLALGSSGVPETFVVDGQGVIRMQHVGDIRAEDIAKLQRALAEAERPE